MPFELEEIRKFQQDHRTQSHARVIIPERAAVKAEAVTGDERWDAFLSYIEGMIRDAKGRADKATDVLADPSIVDHNRLMEAKIWRAEARATAHALETVLALPRALKESHEGVGDEQS